MAGLFFYKSNDGTAWRGMFGLGIILPAIMILLACFVMPESPRWLASKGRDDEARGVLRQVYPPGEHICNYLRVIYIWLHFV